MTIVAPRGAGFAPAPSSFEFAPSTVVEHDYVGFDDATAAEKHLACIEPAGVPDEVIAARMAVRRDLLCGNDPVLGPQTDMQAIRSQLQEARQAISLQPGSNHQHELGRLDILGAVAEARLGGSLPRAIGHIARAASRISEAHYEPLATTERPPFSWRIVGLAGSAIVSRVLPRRFDGAAHERAVAATNFR